MRRSGSGLVSALLLNVRFPRCAQSRGERCCRGAPGRRGAAMPFPAHPKGSFWWSFLPSKTTLGNMLWVRSEGAAAPRSRKSAGTAGYRESGPVHPASRPGSAVQHVLNGTARVLPPPPRDRPATTGKRCQPRVTFTPGGGEVGAAQPPLAGGGMSDSLPVAGTGASLLMLR